VVLFPLPAALLTGAPPEMKLAAVYVVLVSLALFLALAEVGQSVRRLAEAVDRQHGTS
jgi:cell division protein FtsX